ncbi:hypothetical protein SAMN05444340_1314 [Citreimonas salinaria]|uniref:Uncharacterized protein n=1 Tax=Citreimonas salinaria TaxID=321339 RepID=A0A1H3NVN8_9RHOB|nr:hypothetical protein SAMN05444340_1314 [Citreimonas salinaria]
MSSSYTDRGFCISGEMHLAATSRMQTDCENVVEVLSGSSVIQDVRGYGGWQLEININGMTLCGTDLAATDREPLLVVDPHDFLKLLSGHGPARFLEHAQKLVDPRPSRSVEPKADQPGLVAENAREELALTAHGSFAIRRSAAAGRYFRPFPHLSLTARRPAVNAEDPQDTPHETDQPPLPCGPVSKDPQVGSDFQQALPETGALLCFRRQDFCEPSRNLLSVCMKNVFSCRRDPYPVECRPQYLDFGSKFLLGHFMRRCPNH